MCEIARVAELVYAHDLKSCLVRDVGSTPTSGTNKRLASAGLFICAREQENCFSCVWGVENLEPIF